MVMAVAATWEACGDHGPETSRIASSMESQMVNREDKYELQGKELPFVSFPWEEVHLVRILHSSFQSLNRREDVNSTQTRLERTLLCHPTPFIIERSIPLLLRVLLADTLHFSNLWRFSLTEESCVSQHYTPLLILWCASIETVCIHSWLMTLVPSFRTPVGRWLWLHQSPVSPVPILPLPSPHRF